MISLTRLSSRLQPLIMMVLLFAVCGLAGHFVLDALCGSYIVTEHECQERQPASTEVLGDCCCTHPGFMLPSPATAASSFTFTFHFALTPPQRVSAAIRPLSPPPMPVSPAIF